jgi:hypothetical protein
MAQIDLKFATINISDGYGGAFTVNQPATPPAVGDTTLTIAGFTGVIQTGDVFTVAGDLNASGLIQHTVLTHTETTSNTTSITFTPALTVAVADKAVGALLPHALTLFLGDGTLEYTEHRNVEYKLNQGRLKYSRLGDEQPMDVSLDFVWEFLTAASADLIPTPEDAIKRRGKASTWVTSGSDPCEPYAVNVTVDYMSPCPGTDKETIVLKEFRYEELQHSFKNAQISVKGKCKVREASPARSANPNPLMS